MDRVTLEVGRELDVDAECWCFKLESLSCPHHLACALGLTPGYFR